MEILCTFVILDKYHQFAQSLPTYDDDLCKSEGLKMSSLYGFNLHFSYYGWGWESFLYVLKAIYVLSSVYLGLLWFIIMTGKQEVIH